MYVYVFVFLGCIWMMEFDLFCLKGIFVSIFVIDCIVLIEYFVFDVFVGCWSFCVFDVQNMIDEVKFVIVFEVVCWSLFVNNIQFWCFIVVCCGIVLYVQVVDVLMGFNQVWVGNVVVFVVVIVEIEMIDGILFIYVFYDFGQVVVYFFVQVYYDGLFVYQMSGFDLEVVCEFVDFELCFVFVMVFVVGEFGDIEVLFEVLQQCEVVLCVCCLIVEMVIFSV